LKIFYNNFKDEYFHEIIFDPDEDISTNLDKTKSFVSKNINLFKEKDSRKNTAKKSTQKSAKKVTNEKPGWLPISLWIDKTLTSNSSNDEKKSEELESGKDPP